MAAQAGVRKILNDVITGDSTVEYLGIETVTSMYPGAAVKKGSTDYDVVVCADDALATGWLGYGACNGSDKPATRDTIYLDEAEVPVHSGGGFYVRAVCASEAIAKGAELKVGAAGIVTAATIGTDHVVAKAAETVADTATSIWVMSYL